MHAVFPKVRVLSTKCKVAQMTLAEAISQYVVGAGPSIPSTTSGSRGQLVACCGRHAR